MCLPIWPIGYIVFVGLYVHRFSSNCMYSSIGKKSWNQHFCDNRNLKNSRFCRIQSQLLDPGKDIEKSEL